MCKAVSYASRNEWLEGRKKGMGGSDVASALGLSPWRTPVELWQEKRGEGQPQECSQAMHWGTILESTIAYEFGIETGMTIARCPFTFVDGEDDWQRANIDRAIVPNSETEPVVDGKPNFRKILECKTANAFSASQWGESQLDEIKAGKVISEHKIPLYYETQVQWYMGLTGAEVCYVAVLIGGSDFRVYEVPRNQAVIDSLKEKMSDFWFNYVKAGKKPQAIDLDDVRHLYQVESGTMVEASAETAVAIGEYRNLKGQIDALKKQLDAVATQIGVAVGENEGLTIGGEKAVTFKAQSRATFDAKQLKADSPEIWAKYAGRSAPSRVLRVY